VTQEPKRRSSRVEISRSAVIRGVCGDFHATAEDLSLTGVRIRVTRAELRILDSADLATAAATLQTRVGSRCRLALGPLRMSRPLCKNVEIVRLVLPTGEPDKLELGCRFEEPLTEAECAALRVEIPRTVQDEVVRSELSWADQQRPPLDPTLSREKVEALFDVSQERSHGPSERSPRRPLRVVLMSMPGSPGGPLACTAEALSISTILVRVGAEQARTWLTGKRDLSEVADLIKTDYGDWPELEITDGARRLWRGGVRVYGLEVGNACDQDIFLRLVFGRRLREQELDGLCAAA
jgi:hypothetical protein